MPPMSWTSYGTMSHVELAAGDASPSCRRGGAHASRTVANASGRISSRTSAIASRSSPSAPPRPSPPLSSLSIRSRSVGIARRALLLLELGDARFELARPLANDRAELRRLAAQLLFGDRLQPRVMLVDLVDDRLDLASARARGAFR